jgi:DNA-binding response OmpR family regulator
MKKILVVDDELKITQLVRDYLEHAGYKVFTAADGNQAMMVFRGEHPELVVLDLGLPGLDGLDVTREMRKTSSVPIIMLTARGDESDKLVGLELGADDYVTKPFSPKELVARIRAVLRRAEVMTSGHAVTQVGELTIDPSRMRVSLHGHNIDLTATEFEILSALANQPGRVFTRAQLLDAVRGIAFESYERAIDAHIKNIRRKLEPEPHDPHYILTVHGVGYKFTDAQT